MDVVFENHGSIFLARAVTTAGGEWLEEHVEFQAHFGGAGVVEPRYVADLVQGLEADGLTVSIVP